MTSRSAPEWITERHKRYRRAAWLWKWLFNPRLTLLPILFTQWGGPFRRLFIFGYEFRYVPAALLVLLGVADCVLHASDRARNFCGAADCLDIAIARYEASADLPDTTLVEADMQSTSLLQRRTSGGKLFSKEEAD